MDFESFTKLRQDGITRAQINRERYHILYEQAVRENARENKIESYQKQEQNAAETAAFLQAELEIARPEIPADIEERGRIRGTYPDLIKNNVSEDNPLYFHGVRSFVTLEDILSSGRLGYLENAETSSHTTPGQVDVTTANSVATSIEGFVGLSCDGVNKFLPAGCLIAVAPKDEQEKAYAKQGGTEHHISTVDFKENPDRIVAIISTTENKNRLTMLAEKYGIDLGKIHTFDSFIEHLSQAKSKDFNKDLEQSGVYKIAHAIGIDTSIYKVSDEDALKNAQIEIKQVIKRRQYENTEAQNAVDFKKLDDKPQLQEQYKDIIKEEEPNKEVEDKAKQKTENESKEGKEEHTSIGDLLRKLSGRSIKSTDSQNPMKSISDPVKTTAKAVKTTATVIKNIQLRNQRNP